MGFTCSWNEVEVGMNWESTKLIPNRTESRRTEKGFDSAPTACRVTDTDNKTDIEIEQLSSNMFLVGFYLLSNDKRISEGRSHSKRELEAIDRRKQTISFIDEHEISY